MKQLKDTPLSTLALAPVQEGGTAADAFRCTLDLAQHVEREARRLLTTHRQMHVNLIGGVPEQMPPPVESVDGIWSPMEQASVAQTLRTSIVGDPDTVTRKLQARLG